MNLERKFKKFRIFIVMHISRQYFVFCTKRSTNIKEMLRSESIGSLRSPRSDGCMITVSVVNKQHEDSLRDTHDRSHCTETADSVVTAVRIRLDRKSVV